MAFWGVAFDLNPGMLVHVAALCQLSGFLLRDQLKLRALVALGGVFYLAYYLYAPAAPLWEAMFWTSAMLVANIAMIAVIARNRRAHGLNDDALMLFSAFASIEPGDMRRLMQLGAVTRAAEPQELTRLGERSGKLFYVIDGALTIRRAEGALAAQGPMFIGEAGYLLDRPASATVVSAPGARVLVWDTAALRALCARHERIGRALEVALNRDLAAKIHAGAHASEAAPQA